MPQHYISSHLALPPRCVAGTVISHSVTSANARLATRPVLALPARSPEP